MTALKELIHVADRLEPRVAVGMSGFRYKVRIGLMKAINSKIVTLRI